MSEHSTKGSEAPPALRATVLDRGYAARTLRLAGPVVATVEYRGYGLGYESVYVNRRLAARVSHQGPEMCAPHIEFEVASGGRAVPAAVDVSMWPWFKIRQFRLTVDGLVVYSEGEIAEPVQAPPRSDLPIPAPPHTPPAPGVLPIPSEPPAAVDPPAARTHPAVLPLVLLAVLCPLTALVTDLFLPPLAPPPAQAVPSDRRQWHMMDTPARYWLGYPARGAGGQVELRPLPFTDPAPMRSPESSGSAPTPGR